MLALFVTSKSLSANDVEEIFFAALAFRIKSPQSVASPPSRKKKITIVWRSDRTASLLSPNAPLLVPSDLVLVRRTRERTRACAFLKLTKLVLDQWRSARLVFGGALNG